MVEAILFLHFSFSIALLIGFYRKQEGKNNPPSNEGFTVLIPFRNEEEVIAESCKAVINGLESTSHQFEVIWLNDHSEDNSLPLLLSSIPQNDARFKVITTRSKGKKSALSEGVECAMYPIVLCLDADVFPESGWPSGMLAPFGNDAIKMVCGDVHVQNDSTPQSVFEALDTLSLVASARATLQLGWPVMCNGANLGYRKEAFRSVGGYEGNENIASGDDVFLLHKMMTTFPGSICMSDITSKTAVLTPPQPSWGDVWKQRVRWASKTTAYRSPYAWMVAIWVGVASFAVVFLLFLSIWNFEKFNYLFLEFWIGKALIDYTVLRLFARKYELDHYFFKKQRVRIFPILQALLHPFYTLAIAIRAMFKGVEWKGRS